MKNITFLFLKYSTIVCLSLFLTINTSNSETITSLDYNNFNNCKKDIKETFQKIEKKNF